MLLSVDSEIFRPIDSHFPRESPFNYIVDFSKYSNLSKDAKEILYRPPKVKKLYEKYWELAKVTQNRKDLELKAKAGNA